jgi:glucosamine--fructose-6-phosphate aminotransferase (isomerizing)
MPARYSLKTAGEAHGEAQMTDPITTSRTAMAEEIREAPQAIARFFDREAANLRDTVRRLAERQPSVIVTCARGSSDNAAVFFKYLTEILLGIPVASIGPSVASLYHAPLRLAGGVMISVSQSGQSPDIVSLQTSAQSAGAFAIAVVNDVNSPLARGADAVLPFHSGVERSIAATKTFLSSAAILAALVAEWRGDALLTKATRELPEVLEKTLRTDWSEALPILHKAHSAYVVGRGPALPIAAEAALKLKESATLHAEAFSAAEIMHGPLQLVEAGFPVIALRPRDAAYESMGEAVFRLESIGARVLVAESGAPRPSRLPSIPSSHPLLDSLVMLLSFYALVEQVARARGHDPDRPTRLRKVTETK